MESLRKLLEKVNTENPTPFDLKIASLSNYYIGLERKRDIKKLRRLKLLVHLYPSIIEKNTFRVIQAFVENPNEQSLIVKSNPEKITAFEHKLMRKYYGDIIYERNIDINNKFRVTDLYEYFGLGD